MPLTTEDLMTLWKSVVDDGYSRPFIDGKQDGLETNIEVFEQLAAQLAFASESIENSTQEMFLLPYSGQTAPPASEGQPATVVLTFTRDRLFELPIVFERGAVAFREIATDWGDEGAVDVVTGRTYVAQTSASLSPGAGGPVFLTAASNRQGFGFNLAEPGSIRSFRQPGSGMSNDGARVVTGTAAHRLIVRPDPDVVIPEHVGQYVQFMTGANAGQVRRVIGYEGPIPTGSNANGGTAVLAATGVYVIGTVTGEFLQDEEVYQVIGASTTARGVFRGTSNDRIVIDRSFGDFATGLVIGVLSGAFATVTSIDQSPDMVAEQLNVPYGAPGAGWRLMDWETDLGITVTNVDWPSGGRSPMLDELGAERLIYRQPGELDSAYRKRVARIADQISPNAIRRICNRITARIGADSCLREVGSTKFPGVFYDGDPSNPDPSIAFAYDMDFAVRPMDRYKLMLDYEEFRAFFLVGLPPVVHGDFGIAYDAGPCDAYDAAPYFAQFDGFGLDQAVIYKTIWSAVDAARAAGVGFDLYPETIGCF